MEQFAWSEAALASNVRNSPCPWHMLPLPSLEAGLRPACLTLLSPSSGTRLEASKGGLWTLPGRLQRAFSPRSSQAPAAVRRADPGRLLGFGLAPVLRGTRPPGHSLMQDAGLWRDSGPGRGKDGKRQQDCARRASGSPGRRLLGAGEGRGGDRGSGFLGRAEQQSWPQHVTLATPPS